MDLLEDVEEIVEYLEHLEGLEDERLTLRHVLDLQVKLLKRVNRMASDIDVAIQAALKADEDAITAIGERVTQIVGPLEAKITELVAAAPPHIDTQAALDGIAHLKAIADSIATLPPASDPAGPPTPDQPPLAPPPTAPPVSASKPLYTHNDADFGPVAAAAAGAWPTADVTTAETPPRVLYTFIGDPEGGSATAASPEWPAYNGPTQPVGAAPSTPPPDPGAPPPADGPPAVVGDPGGQEPADAPPPANPLGLTPPPGLKSASSDASASSSLSSSAPPPPQQ